MLEILATRHNGATTVQGTTFPKVLLPNGNADRTATFAAGHIGEA
jgi:hypothetical protein